MCANTGVFVVQVLLNYLHVKGYPADEYKCLQSWPRRDVSDPCVLLMAVSSEKTNEGECEYKRW